MREVYVIGAGMTPFGRFLETPLRRMAEDAVRLALKDAGAQERDIEAIAFGNSVQGAIEGQFGVRGQSALRDMDFDLVPIINVENACASASTAFNIAYTQILAGSADVALAVGAEKMVSAEPGRSMGAFEGSWDISRRDETIAGLKAMGAGTQTPPEELARESERSVFMDIYAAFAKQHMARFGTTQRQIAAVAAKNHTHSVENPLSQYRKPFTVDQVMDARLIAWPFTLPMCSPISDGAAAAVLCSKEALARFAPARAVKIRASILGNGGRRGADEIERHISRRASQKVYELAGVGPDDIDVVECHDATAFGEIQQSETLGFFPFGEGGPAAERGETALGGRIPFNPSGGLESKGHPIGATGLGQIHELVTQLRGEAGRRQVEGARIALAENGGGLMGVEEAAISLIVLEAPLA